MATDPAETIRLAAKAYVAGEGDDLEKQLDVNLSLHGSHWNDRWTSRDDAIGGLENELARHKRSAAEGSPPTGPLVTAARRLDLEEGQPIAVEDKEGELYQAGHWEAGMAWWTVRGGLTIDGTTIPDASWTVILKECDVSEELGGPWQIVHSHFSIPHVPSA